MKDGYLEVPNRPGLGIDINEEILQEYLDCNDQNSVSRETIIQNILNDK